jgi:Fe-S cluster biosynthesis and repair protein YggX
MADLDARIEQFQNMASADPNNDMAHFSLGNALMQAGRHLEAAASLRQATAINPELSKAYQLAGECLIAAGDEPQAISVLMTGYEMAARRGDMLPKNAMEEILRRLGQEPPELSEDAQQEAEEAEIEGGFVCSRTGRKGTKLEEPPMRGPLGEWIVEHISSETWTAWIHQGTKVINELRLDFSRERDQQTYEEHMCDYLGIEPELYKELTGGA